MGFQAKYLALFGTPDKKLHFMYGKVVFFVTFIQFLFYGTNVSWLIFAGGLSILASFVVGFLKEYVVDKYFRHGFADINDAIATGLGGVFGFGILAFVFIMKEIISYLF